MDLSLLPEGSDSKSLCLGWEQSADTGGHTDPGGTVMEEVRMDSMMAV